MLSLVASALLGYSFNLGGAPEAPEVGHVHSETRVINSEQQKNDGVGMPHLPLRSQVCVAFDCDGLKAPAPPENDRSSAFVYGAATVVAISANGMSTAEDKQAAQSEINEVLTHLDQLKTAIVAK